MTRVFLTGATGYVGGSALSAILKDKNYEVTVIVRDESKKKKLEELGVEVVVGSLDDAELVTRESSKVDVVFNLADSDNYGAAEAIIEGLKKRSSGSKKPILIHCSGTGVLGNRDSNIKPYNDDVPEDTQLGGRIPATAMHRDVDKIVIEAGASGAIDTYIVCPPLIYGKGTGQFNQKSVQIPALIKTAIKRKQPVTSEIKFEWSTVHVEDLADFFVLLAKKALAGEAPKNENGYYFTENGTISWRVLVAAIGKNLFERKLVDTTEVKIDANEEFGGLKIAVDCQSISKAVKGRRLGWNPTRPDVLSSLEEMIDLQLEA